MTVANEIYKTCTGAFMMIQEGRVYWLGKDLIGSPSGFTPVNVKRNTAVFELIGRNLKFK